MTAAKPKTEVFSFQNVLIMIVIGISGWNLRTTVDILVAASADHVQVINNSKSISALGDRVGALESVRRYSPQTRSP